jgi:hypothetical protein
MQNMNDMIQMLFGQQGPQFDMEYHLMSEVVPRSMYGVIESNRKINVFREMLISFHYEEEGE